MRGKRSLSIIALCVVALAAFLLTGPARLWGQRVGEAVSVAASDSYIYRLELNGLPTDVYTSCSGLGSSSDIDEQRALTDERVLVWQATPGALRWNKIILKRDSLSTRQIWEWRRAVEMGQLAVAFKSGAIVMLGSNSQQEYARWTFTNGWPAKLSFNDGVEELVIVHDGLTLVGIGGTSTTGTKKR